jgi:hypothetical protein
MIPPGLTMPRRDAFRDALPSEAQPHDYPSQMPFVVNQAVTYAASVDLATCSWPMLPAGEHPAARADRNSGLRGMAAAVRDGMLTLTTPLDATAKDLLDDLFDRVLAAAAASGWEVDVTAPTPFPPAWHHTTTTRPGERLVIMALPTPYGSSVTAFSFAEPVA